MEILENMILIVEFDMIAFKIFIYIEMIILILLHTFVWHKAGQWPNE